MDALSKLFAIFFIGVVCGILTALIASLIDRMDT